MVTLSKIIEGLEMVDKNEYQIMVDFIETIDNDKTKEELKRLIQGKSAFKRFKDYCFESNIIQDWYKYKDIKK